MSTIDLASVSLDLWEGGDGPPLLFLHGAGGFHADHPFLGLLGRHRRITAPSHPGFGSSSLPEWIDRPEDIAHVYLALLDRMGTRPIDLIACSLGGWIGAELTSMAPEKFRRLIFVAPVGVKLGSRDTLDIPDIFATPAAAMEKLLYREPEKFRADPSAMTDQELTVMLRNRETTALLTWEPYMHNPKLRHRMHRVTNPALFLRGEHDGLISASYIDGYAKLLPDARVLTLPAAGHVPHVETPDEFVTAALGFLNGEGR
jgi:pimeloyl-ACP methyl ester carboxylesterase